MSTAESMGNKGAPILDRATALVADEGRPLGPKGPGPLSQFARLPGVNAKPVNRQMQLRGKGYQTLVTGPLGFAFWGLGMEPVRVEVVLGVKFAAALDRKSVV